MNWVDLLVILIVAVATFSSARAGLVRQALALIGFVAGLYAALTHHLTLASMLQTALPDPAIAKVAAFVIIMVGVWIAFAVLAGIVRSILRASGLAWVDHVSGMVLGLVAGLLLSICILLLFVRIPITAIHTTVHESTLATWLLELLPHLRQLLPENVQAHGVM